MAHNSEYADITILIDASGSMDDYGSEAVDGVNTLIQEQAALGKATVTIWTFSTPDRIQQIMPTTEVTTDLVLDKSKYNPSGGTAFNQAMGFVITATGKRYANWKPGEPYPTKRIFAVMTDGKENSSRGEWMGARGAAKVREMIEHQTQVYKWEFMFLAANMDAQGAGKAYGFESGNIQAFATETGAVSRGVVGLSSMITRSRVGSTPTPAPILTPDPLPEPEVFWSDQPAVDIEDPDDTLGASRHLNLQSRKLRS